MLRLLCSVSALLLAQIALADAPENCSACHTQVVTNKFIHKALTLPGNACLGCHNEHTSQENSGMLKAAAPQLCFGCHENKYTTGKSKHHVVTSGKACLNCHNPHSGVTETLLVQEKPALCFSCHNQSIAATDRVIPNIKEKVALPFSAHAVLNCDDCHLSHNSPFDRLLSANFPALRHAAYKPQTYALCFTCHDQNMMNETIRGNETRFFNDSDSWGNKKRLNLHWLHVTKATNGSNPESAYSCATCHDVHGSAMNHNIGPFPLPTMSRLKYTAAASGGTCAGSCHSSITYSRKF